MIERDRDYEAFYAKWKPRLGLKDRHIALGYLRGFGQQDDALEPDATKINVSVRLDGRGLDAQPDPDGSTEHLVGFWAHIIDEEQDKKRFTKDFIYESIALNNHYGEACTYLIAAALWLTAESRSALASLLEQPGRTLLCEFTSENDRGRRLKLVIFKDD